MAARRYRCTWDDIAWLDADHMAKWGAFSPGCNQTIDFDTDSLPSLAYTMETIDAFTAYYQWCSAGRRADPTAPFIRSRVAIARRGCRFGGTRAYFVCPYCRRHTLRLAVLPEGLSCGTCGRVTWASRREQPIQRKVRKANRLAFRLGCDSWIEPPLQRPARMRIETYVRLAERRATMAVELDRDLSRRLARSSLFRRWAYLAKL